MSKAKTCVGKNIFERVNYLYQLSNFMSHSEHNTASALYTHLLLDIAKKSIQVLKLDPNIKRTICKKCHCVLIAGVSLKVRIRKKRIIQTCKICQMSKVYGTEKKSELWVHTEAAVKEILQF